MDASRRRLLMATEEGLDGADTVRASGMSTLVRISQKKGRHQCNTAERAKSSEHAVDRKNHHIQIVQPLQAQARKKTKPHFPSPWLGTCISTFLAPSFLSENCTRCPVDEAALGSDNHSPSLKKLSFFTCFQLCSGDNLWHLVFLPHFHLVRTVDATPPLFSTAQLMFRSLRSRSTSSTPIIVRQL